LYINTSCDIIGKKPGDAMPVLEATMTEGLAGMDAKAFGARLRELREGAGLTQKELADRAGLSQNAVSQWEQGNREPLVSNAMTLAEVLGCDIADLFKSPSPGTKPAGRGRPPRGGPPRRGRRRGKPS
jgi:DNA-binding XRE family transcriptional regulator